MKKYLPLCIVTPLVLILDQWSKIWILRNLPQGQRITAIPGYFEIVHIKNPGAAFGMFARWDSEFRNWFFYGISVLAMGALFMLYAKTKPTERRVQIPLALILGGAIGNLIDRLYQGVVTDFLLLHWHEKVANFELFGKTFRFVLSWPAFNIADSAITCGAIYLASVILFSKKKV